jgi:hypothetical protein
MNERRVASRMGGKGWTAAKVKEAAEGKTPRRLRKRGPLNGMTALPREAPEGLMRAWLKVLHDRHPDATWVPASQQPVTTSTAPTKQLTARRSELARSA